MREWARCGASALAVLGSRMQNPMPEVDGLPGLLRGLSGNVQDGLPYGTEIIDDEDPRCAVFRCDGRFGYADLQDRRILLQNIYLDAKPFREGLAVVRLEEGFWMIDPRGHCRIDCRDYRSVEPLSEGLALVSDGSLYGFIDREGRRAIPLRYVFATSFRKGWPPCGSGINSDISTCRVSWRGRRFSTMPVVFGTVVRGSKKRRIVFYRAFRSKVADSGLK